MSQSVCHDLTGGTADNHGASQSLQANMEMVQAAMMVRAAIS